MNLCYHQTLKVQIFSDLILYFFIIIWEKYDVWVMPWEFLIRFTRPIFQNRSELLLSNTLNPLDTEVFAKLMYWERGERSAGLQQYFIWIFLELYRIEQSLLASVMTNNVWIRFIIELVALASLIALMTQNNFGGAQPSFSRKWVTGKINQTDGLKGLLKWRIYIGVTSCKI